MTINKILSVILISLLAINTSYASEKKDEMESKKAEATEKAKQIKRDAASGLPTGKRDAASGLPTGKRQHKPLTRDAASGLPSGKRQHKPVTGDATTGLPTGKRQHKPLSVTKGIDKATPAVSKPTKPVKLKAGYKLCPDGSTVKRATKCPS